MKAQLAAIGDVHGSIDQLREVVPRALSLADRLVFVGDYVNRGQQSAEVIDYLIDLRFSYPQTVFLDGHHDASFRECLEDGRLAQFLRMGGATTVRSYLQESVPSDVLGALRAAVPPSHRRFLGQLEGIFVDRSGVVITHQIDHPSVEEARFRIAGHTPLRSLVPRVEDSLALIDTGCGTLPDGRLTCLLWPSLDWWQSKTADPPLGNQDSS